MRPSPLERDGCCRRDQRGGETVPPYRGPGIGRDAGRPWRIAFRCAVLCCRPWQSGTRGSRTASGGRSRLWVLRLGGPARGWPRCGRLWKPRSASRCAGCAVAYSEVSGGCSELSPLAASQAASSLWPLLGGGRCGSSGHCRLSPFQLSLKHDQLFQGPSGAPGVELILAPSCCGLPYTGWVTPCSFPTSFLRLPSYKV